MKKIPLLPTDIKPEEVKFISTWLDRLVIQDPRPRSIPSNDKYPKP